MSQNTAGYKISQTIAEPILTGALTALGSYAMGNTGTYDILGTKINVHLGYGLASGTSSFFSESVTNFIVPLVTKNPETAKTVAMVSNPLVVGTGTAVGCKLFCNPPLPNSQLIKPFGLGAGAQVASSYAYSTVLSGYVASKQKSY
jgi:hypothetical protein